MELPKELVCDPLIIWFRNCLEHKSESCTFEDLFQEEPLYNLLLKVNSEPLTCEKAPEKESNIIRKTFLDNFMQNVQNFYSEHMNKAILKAPDTNGIATKPQEYVEDVKLFIILFLGCAIHCYDKNWFYNKILNLSLNEFITFLDYIEVLKSVITNKRVKAFHQFKNIFSIKSKQKERSFSEGDTTDHSFLNTACTEMNHADMSCDHMNCSISLLYKIKLQKMHEQLQETEEQLNKCMDENELQKQKINEFMEKEASVPEKITIAVQAEEIDLRRIERSESSQESLPLGKPLCTFFDFRTTFHRLVRTLNNMFHLSTFKRRKIDPSIV